MSTVNVAYSQRLKYMESALDDLPRKVARRMKAVYKRRAEMFVKTFQDGVRNEEFHLRRLKTATVARKAAAGYPQPETPLYGLGDAANDRSYVNMLRIREVENGYRVRPSIAKHWSGRIALRVLYFIHEFGATIRTRTGGVIIIPPRPAVSRALTALKRSRLWKETAHTLKKILREGLKR